MDEVRLIDANAFIEYAKDRLDICAGDLIAMIDDQPTAYDIDKVVEQLEENWKENHNCYAITRSGYYEGKMDAYDIAIEIVKGGEINE